MLRRSRQFVVALIGPIGSGKTYVSRMLAKRLGALHLRTDAIRMRLRRQGKPISRAIAISDRRRDLALRRGNSVILDFDAVHAQRQRELKALARHHGARIVFIRVIAPEVVILKRLRAQRYPIPGVFNSLRHALLAYFSRRRFHRRKLRVGPLFVINNDGRAPLEPQIAKVARYIRGL